jgi:hypothetical protein
VVVQDWKKRSRVKIKCNKMPKKKEKAVEDPLPAENVGEDDELWLGEFDLEDEDDELDDPPPAQPNPQV